MLRVLAAVLLLVLPLASVAADEVAKLNDRGLAHLKAQEYPQALVAFREALGLSPANPVLLKNLAYAHAGQGVAYLEKIQPRPAITHLRKALETFKGDVGFNFWLGVAYYRNRDFFSATVELRFVLETEPKRAKAWEYLGFTYYQRNLLSEATDAWKRSLALEADNDNLRGWMEKVGREARVEKAYAKVQSPHFSVLYDRERSAAAAKVCRPMLEAAYREMGAALGIYPVSAVTVILYPTKAFHAVTGTHGWVGGLFDGKVRIPVKDVTVAGDPLRRLIRHEYAHVLVAQVAPGCPAWLNEGVAQLFEPGGQPALAALVKKTHAAGRLLRMGQLASNFGKLGTPERIKLAYAQSWSFVAFLDGVYGRKDLAAVLRRLGGGDTIDQACRAVLKLPLAELEALWKRGL